MKGDITRLTFDRRRHATSVRKQQGRVDLDADWNEQRDIDEHLRSTSLVDIVGPEGAPVDDAAFALTPAGSDLMLSQGRYYLDGVLCECDDPVSLFAQPDLPPGGPFVRRTDGTWLASGTPIPAAVYSVWLHTFGQHRGVVEWPELREVALGGTDTTTRTRTVWQVRLLELGPLGTVATCGDQPAGWDELTAPSTGTFAAWADPIGNTANDCSVPTNSPYTGLDNQTYRWEIVQAGGPGVARYAYSHDNGSIVASWEAIDTNVVTVKSPGRDGSTGFTNGCWVELTDDTRELLGQPGTLVQVDRAEGDHLVIKPLTAIGDLDRAKFPLRPRVRRWDGIGTVPADGSELTFEFGVKGKFSGAVGATYGLGDWWAAPARAAVRDIEWPRVGGAAKDLLPFGPRRGDARLAVVSFDGTAWSVVRDCRPVFAPLADQVTLSMLGGDGQEATPVVGDPTALVPLGHNLVVWVSSGGRPMAHARVTFAVSQGSGHVKGSAQPVTVETDIGGVARCAWELDSGTDVQEVTVRLRDNTGAPEHLPLRFVATLSKASNVAYDPSACVNLAGATTVQAAIDRLCQASGGGCATVTLSPGSDWVEALRSLPAEQDAVVCFRPGEYLADTGVRLEGLGHVELHGGGPSTRIRVSKDEAAITFVKCASVTVERLSIEIERLPGEPVEGLLGVVTAIDCGDVTVDSVRLTCPADATHRATCLTVRADGALPGSTRVTSSDLVVGHAQDGVLLVNVDRAVVHDCTFRTPAKPASLTFSKLLLDRARLQSLRKTLLGRLVAEPANRIDTGGFNTVLTVQNWAVRLNSTVPKGEWSAMMAANPPSDADAASPAAMQAYVSRLVDSAAAEPSRLPTYGRQLQSLRGRLGGSSGRVFDTAEGQATLRNFLVTDAPDVRPLEAVALTRRSVALNLGTNALRFDSPLPQRTWEAMIDAVPPERAETSAGWTKHLKTLASRLLTDADFGARYAGAFRKQLEDRNPAAAHCAVVIAGQTVGEVEVSGNRMLSTAEGVHVAVSSRRARGGATRAARAVHVRGNEIRLAVPMELAGAPRGIFVGNANRAIVAENRVSVEAGSALAGVHVEGFFGPQVLIRDNLLENCEIGVRVSPCGEPPNTRLWSVTDNVAVGAGTAVSAPHFVRQSGNV